MYNEEEKIRNLEKFHAGTDVPRYAGDQSVSLHNQSELISIEKDCDEFIERLHKGQLLVTKERITPLGKRFREKGKDWELASRVASIPSYYIDVFMAHPIVEVIYKMNVEHDIQCAFELNLNYSPRGIPMYEYIEKWIDVIKKKTISKAFKKKVSNITGNSKKRVRRMNNIHQKIMTCCARIVVCRVDLFYKMKFRSLKTLEDFESDYNRLMTNIKRNKAIYDGLLAVIAKMEYGEYKGLHVHMLFFYNGRHVYRDDRKAEMIGRYWNDVVTKGEGQFFSTNRSAAKKALSQYIRVPVDMLGIGVIHRSDQEKITQLKVVFRYFGKYEQNLRVEGKRKFRAFRTSETPYLNKMYKRITEKGDGLCI